MSGWIKFWKDMPNDPRVLSAAAKLSQRYVLARRTPGGGSDLSATETCNAWRNAVTGALATLWCYADEHIRDDDTLPLTSQTLDAVVGIEGFFDAIPREWIDELDDGSVVLPGYCEKNSLITKRKRTIKSNARVTRWRRSKKADCNGVTTDHVTQCNAAGDRDKDKDKDPREREERAREGVPRGTVVDCGTNLTRTAAEIYGSMLEDWRRDVPECNPDAFARWIVHRENRGKMMGADQRLGQAKLLAGNGDFGVQAEVVDFCIAQGWNSLVPIDDVRARRDGMSRAKPEKKRWHPNDGDPTEPARLV
jgi:hypothetical protein